MSEIVDLNERLATAFAKSNLMAKKIPETARRKQFLESLLKAPDHQKQLFLAFLEKGDHALDAQAEKMLSELMIAKAEMQGLLSDSKQLLKAIEQEEQAQSAEDILKQL